MYRALSESTGLKYYLSVASDASCESGCRERGGCHTQPSAGATVQGFQSGLTDGVGNVINIRIDPSVVPIVQSFRYGLFYCSSHCTTIGKFQTVDTQCNIPSESSSRLKFIVGKVVFLEAYHSHPEKCQY